MPSHVPQTQGTKKRKKEPLGKGKSGTVHEYTKDRIKFAVKRSTSKKYIADCVKEYNMLLKLHKMGITDVPRCFGCFKNDDFVEVVMEIARGQDLKYIAKGDITLPEAQQIMGSVANTLATIHANRIVHNDLHNGNVKVYIGRGKIGTKRKIETKTIDWGDVKIGEKSQEGTNPKVLKDAKQFAALAAFTFGQARASTQADAARKVMNKGDTSLEYLYNFTKQWDLAGSGVHMWSRRQDGKFWTPIYDERQDMTGSGWGYVKGEHYPEDGTCYNIFQRGDEMRKVWTPTDVCREC